MHDSATTTTTTTTTLVDSQKNIRRPRNNKKKALALKDPLSSISLDTKTHQQQQLSPKNQHLSQQRRKQQNNRPGKLLILKRPASAPATPIASPALLAQNKSEERTAPSPLDVSCPSPKHRKEKSRSDKKLTSYGADEKNRGHGSNGPHSPRLRKNFRKGKKEESQAAIKNEIDAIDYLKSNTNVRVGESSSDSEALAITPPETRPFTIADTGLSIRSTRAQIAGDGYRPAGNDFDNRKPPNSPKNGIRNTARNNSHEHSNGSTTPARQQKNAVGGQQIPSSSRNGPVVRRRSVSLMEQGEPGRLQNQLYAGPTFHNSPAPSTLPVPAFMPSPRGQMSFDTTGTRHFSSSLSPPSNPFLMADSGVSRSEVVRDPRDPDLSYRFPQSTATVSPPANKNAFPATDDNGIFAMENDLKKEPFVDEALRMRSRHLLGLLAAHSPSKTKGVADNSSSPPVTIPSSNSPPGHPFQSGGAPPKPVAHNVAASLYQKPLGLQFFNLKSEPNSLSEIAQNLKSLLKIENGH